MRVLIICLALSLAALTGCRSSTSYRHPCAPVATAAPCPTPAPICPTPVLPPPPPGTIPPPPPVR